MRFPTFVLSAVMLGAVASYLNGREVEVTLPARSRHEPTTAAAGLSGPVYWADEQLCPSIPDVASVPDDETVSGRLYQPFASGARSGKAAAKG